MSVSSEFNWFLWGSIGCFTFVVIVIIVIFSSKSGENGRYRDSNK